MALIAFLKGVNVGGHRTFRPTALARRLARFDAVSVGAAGTIVVRGPITMAALRAELLRRLPFETTIAICRAHAVHRALAAHPLAGRVAKPDAVHFVGILAARPRAMPKIPTTMPSRGAWLVKVLAVDGRFVYGAYRRRMGTIGCLSKLDAWVGVPVTTRNLTTFEAIARHTRR